MKRSTETLTLAGWTFELYFAAETGDSRPSLGADTPVARTLDYLQTHQSALQSTILSAIKKEYHKALEDIEAFDLDFIDQMLPPVDTNKDLIKLIEPRAVNIFKTTAGGLHYVGFEFGCTWDEEHGVGVLMHKDRIVSHGGGDVAVLEWMAKRDADASTART